MATALKRGPWLTLFLAASLLISLVDVNFDLNVPPDLYGGAAAVRLMLVVDMMQLCALFAILCWSRLGVIFYVLATLVVPVLSLAHKGSTNGIGLAAILILLVLIRPKWVGMPWGLSAAIK